MPKQSDIEVVDVTPELAHKYLAKNKRNRPIRDRKVKAYARDMAKGNWDDNGETIKFDENDEMIDGQHRMLAVIESDTTIPMIIVHGLAQHAFESIDTGIKRTMADLLKRRGEKNPNDLASILRKIIMWPETVTLDRRTVPTNAEMLALLEEKPWIREVAKEARKICRDCFLPASVLGWCWYKFFQIEPDDCKFFFEKLRTQENLTRGNPIYELHRTLRNEYMDDQSYRSDTWYGVVTVKAWNKYRLGEEGKIFDFKPGGMNPEKPPKIR